MQSELFDICITFCLSPYTLYTECKHFKKGVRIKRLISPHLQYCILVFGFKTSLHAKHSIYITCGSTSQITTQLSRTAVLPYLTWNGLGITYSLLADVLASTHIYRVYTTLSSLSLTLSLTEMPPPSSRPPNCGHCAVPSSTKVSNILRYARRRFSYFFRR